MILDYIEKSYDKGEPIFLAELPCTSKEALRQEMKALTDAGKLIRLYNGVYYKPYKTILGTEGKMSINKYIEKKYIYKNKSRCGYIRGLGLYNKYGFTTQIPSVIEVASNMATTKQRKIDVDGYNIIVYKPLAEINEENISEIEFLDLISDIDIYSEISFSKVKELLNRYPDKTYRNLYNCGLMKYLV